MFKIHEVCGDEDTPDKVADNAIILELPSCRNLHIKEIKYQNGETLLVLRLQDTYFDTISFAKQYHANEIVLKLGFDEERK